MMKYFLFWLMFAVNLVGVFHMHAAETLPEPPAPQKASQPPVGQQLSSVKGVSMVRVKQTAASPAITRIQRHIDKSGVSFEAKNADIKTLLEQTAAVDEDQIVLRTPLPDGIYDFDIAKTEGGDIRIFQLFQTTLTSAFGIQTRIVREEVSVMTMRKTARWDANPLPPMRNVILDKLISLSPWQTKSYSAVRSSGRFWFKGNLDSLARHAESYIGEPIENQTGLEKDFAFDFPMRDSFETADLKAFLESHGIEFVAESRYNNVLYVEPVRGAD